MGTFFHVKCSLKLLQYFLIPSIITCLLAVRLIKALSLYSCFYGQASCQVGQLSVDERQATSSIAEIRSN